MKRFAGLLAILMALTACAAMPAAQQKPFAAFPFRHNAFDFKIAWKTSPTEQGILVDGIMKNVRYSQVDDLEVTVSVLNKGNKVLAESTTFTVPRPITMDEYRSFDLLLKKVVLTQGDVLHFLIKYRVVDDVRSSFNWVSSFSVEALTGVPIVKTEEILSD
jgi:hypothetical protein